MGFLCGYFTAEVYATWYMEPSGMCEYIYVYVDTYCFLSKSQTLLLLKSGASASDAESLMDGLRGFRRFVKVLVAITPKCT